MNETLYLPAARYWGDLVVDIERNALLLPIRKTPAEAVLFSRPGEPPKTFSVPTKMRDARIRALHPDGYWLVTAPADPMTLFALDVETGAQIWRYDVPGRFDPDVRLAIALDVDHSILVAGCGYPHLVRLSPTGKVEHDYYALRPEHQLDFAWRGVVSVAPGPAKQVYLADRNMFSVVMVIDPVEGHIADIGQRSSQTMSQEGSSFREPAWILPDGAGGLWLLELGALRWIRLEASGRPIATRALQSMPSHILSAEQGALWRNQLVVFHRSPDRLVCHALDMRD